MVDNVHAAGGKGAGWAVNGALWKGRDCGVVGRLEEVGELVEDEEVGAGGGAVVF